MHLSKLLKSLQAFNKTQIKQLQKYVCSPYFGVYPPSVLMLDYLAVLHPRFPQKKVTVDTIAELDESLCTLTRQESAGSRLMRAIENFIAQEEWQKNATEMNRYRLQGYKLLGLETEFGKGYEKEIELLNAKAEQDVDVFYERHLLTEMSFNGIKARLNRTRQNDLMPVVKTLDEFYAIKKIRYLCEAGSRKQALGLEYYEQHVSTLFKILEPYTTAQHPYVYLFVNVYKMMHSKNYNECVPHYNCVKQAAANYSGAKVPQSLREAMGYAINSTLGWYNQGNIEASKEYLWWIDWRMKNNLLLDNGKLLPVTFRNVITMAVDSQTPQWMEEKINFYGAYLPEEYKDKYVTFAKGLHQYVLKNYKKAIRLFLLAQTKEEVSLNCAIRRWQWICSYEFDQTDEDMLKNQLLSFEKYLQRNRNELLHLIKVYEIFIDYAKRLLKAATTKNLAKELHNLQQEEHFSGKIWLEQQFSAHKKRPVRLTYGPSK